MIYCVVPKALEAELYDKLVDYYKDDANVTVIVERRQGPDRRAGEAKGPDDRRIIRDRRRRGVSGTFPPIEPAA
jgi:hypothetical protein